MVDEQRGAPLVGTLVNLRGANLLISFVTKAFFSEISTCRQGTYMETKGFCQKGASCTFAHSAEELLADAGNAGISASRRGRQYGLGES